MRDIAFACSRVAPVIAVLGFALACSGGRVTPRLDDGAIADGGSAFDDAAAPDSGLGTDSGPIEDAAPGCVDPSYEIVDCSADACNAIAVVGDEPATSPGMFKGFADPHLVNDPDDEGVVWFSYSWLEVVVGTAPDNTSVWMAVVSNHLARSEDIGSTFSSFEGGELYGPPRQAPTRREAAKTA